MNKVLDVERKLRKMEELGQILCLSVPADLLCEAMDSTQNRTEPRGRHNSNPRNSGLAQVGDAVLDLIVVEILYNKGLSKGETELCKQNLVSNETQRRLLSELWKLTPFFFNDQGFLNDPDIDKPMSASRHIPYLEAVIGVTYLHKGFEYTRRWVADVVYPGLVVAAGLRFFLKYLYLLRADMRTALTVAGSDSCGGAGIQADIKAMNAAGVHAATVITAVTAQNTCSVSKIFPLPADMVQAQLDAVLEDCDIKAVKTGMLYNAEIIDIVADALEDHDAPLIVDPVMVATVGDRLYDRTYIRALKEKLLPLCELVTPNRKEAEILTGLTIEDEDDVAYACEIIGKNGSSVLLKGGHMEGKTVTDYLYLSADITEITNPRLPYEAGHGSGCALSSFIAANMANGLDLVTSVTESRKMIQRSIETQYKIGNGVPVVNLSKVSLKKDDANKVDLIRELDAAVDEISATIPLELVPKTGMNLAFAKKNARGPEEIAAVDKRLIAHNGNVERAGPVKYGAAEHLSYMLLEIMKTNPEVRCVLEIAADEDLPGDLKRAGLKVVPVERVNGEAVSRSIRKTLDKYDKIPDVITDLGSKNPKVDIFGKYPRDVIAKLNRIF